MTLKIGYDARMIENSGIGIRIQHILKYWPFDETQVSLFVFGDPLILRKYQIPTFAKIIEYTAPIYSFQEWKGHSRMREMDILEIPHFNIPILYIKKCIVTIHDLIPYHFKAAHSSIVKRIYLNMILRLIRFFAKKVITVSEFTKQDLIKEFQYPESLITVIYNGIDLGSFRKPNLTSLRGFQKKYKIPKSYLFTVGIGKAHKNFPFLFESLKEIWDQKLLDLPLVIGGISKDIPTDLLSFQKNYKNRIYFLPHLPYHELPLAYAGSKLFVYPSLYEGFGFPVLEAQGTKTPVLSSNASVLPEVLGSSAEYFDPRSKKDLQSKMIALLKDPKRGRQLIQLGNVNAKRFLWKDIIQKIKVFYNTEVFNEL